MNVPIFFVTYLLGYLLVAWFLEIGLKVYRQRKDQWRLRQSWMYRQLDRYGRFTIAILSIVWFYFLVVGVVQFYRDAREKSFDLNRIRHCKDPLYTYCEWRPVASSGCAIDTVKRWWCGTMLLIYANRCVDLDYSMTYCHGASFK